ncbi:uncharacterized protein LOC144158591 isoform X2 [Haemaphysalis longicornis]
MYAVPKTHRRPLPPEPEVPSALLCFSSAQAPKLKRNFQGRLSLDALVLLAGVADLSRCRPRDCSRTSALADQEHMDKIVNSCQCTSWKLFWRCTTPMLVPRRNFRLQEMVHTLLQRLVLTCAPAAHMLATQVTQKKCELEEGFIPACPVNNTIVQLLM